MTHHNRLVPLAWTLLALSACASAPPPNALPDGATPDAPLDVATADTAPVDATPVVDAEPPRDDGKGVRGGPCASPFDCERDLAGRVCLTSSRDPMGRCVECAPGMLCPDGVTVCNNRGSCDNRCASDADCAESELGPRCDVATGACAQCLSRADCPGSLRYCNRAANRCDVGCGDDADCAGQRSFGTPTEHCDAARVAPSCVACVTDAHCAVGEHCSANRCVAGCTATSLCPTGTTCCGGECVDTRASLSHCGACGTACRAPTGATATCTAGVCGVGACLAGRVDCDRSPANGCEADTSADVSHCGACGVACPTRANATATCAAGACGFTCAAGFADCDRDPTNGCEVDTRVSASNCGACGRACAVEHGTGRCAMSACAVAACNAGYTLISGACVLTNPCTASNGGCASNATCEPGAPGARTCTCNSGFVGDGMTCAPESTCTPACAAGQACVNRVCVGDGPLRISLVWDRAGDLDLHVVPVSGEIYYNRRTLNGGTLDRDDTTGTGPENVYWTTTPPMGTYLVCVVPYRIGGATNFTLTVNRPGVPALRFTGARAASTGNAACSATSPHFVGMFTR